MTGEWDEGGHRHHELSSFYLGPESEGRQHLELMAEYFFCNTEVLLFLLMMLYACAILTARSGIISFSFGREIVFFVGPTDHNANGRGLSMVF